MVNPQKVLSCKIFFWHKSIWLIYLTFPSDQELEVQSTPCKHFTFMEKKIDHQSFKWLVKYTFQLHFLDNTPGQCTQFAVTDI
jgi:hypothetical protein